MERKLLAQQREYELQFAACVFGGGHDIALKECCWLEAGNFLDVRLGKFWGDVLLHGDPIRAANDGELTVELLKWVNRVPMVTRPDEYARKVAEMNYYREVIGGLTQIAQAVDHGDSADVISRIGQLQTYERKGSMQAYTAKDIGLEFRTLLTSNTFKKVLTHIQIVDQNLGGLFGNEQIILAGRPATGKTAIALQIARNVAEHGQTVLFLSLEMARGELWARLACGKAGLSWKDVRANCISPQQRIDLANASTILETNLGDRLLVQDEVWTLGEMHQIVARHKSDLVIVDRLDLINWPDPKEKEVVWLGKAARYLRNNIARKMHVPLLLIHQLNREVEKRQEKRPILADLRSSGELEAIADVVLMIYRDDYYSHDTTAKVVQMELWARKNRQGAMNAKMALSYDLERQIITSAPSYMTYAPPP